MENKKILIIDPDAQRVCSRQIRALERAGCIVELAIVIEAIANRKNMHKGLDYYDVIFLEPFFPGGNHYSSNDTHDYLHTGWFIYRDYLKDLINTKVVIWSYCIEDYSYPTPQYPNREWGKNVFVKLKDNANDDSLVDIVKKIINP